MPGHDALSRLQAVVLVTLVALSSVIGTALVSGAYLTPRNDEVVQTIIETHTVTNTETSVLERTETIVDYITTTRVITEAHSEAPAEDISEEEIVTDQPLAEPTETPVPVEEETGEPNDPYSQLDALEAEIDALWQDRSLALRSSYERLARGLDDLESQGIPLEEIERVRQKLFDLFPEEEILSEFPECTTQVFTVPPIDLDELREITPLGNLGPPGHTLPTEHMYLHISAGGTTSRTIPLRAPGEIYITDVVLNPSGEPSGESTIRFALCRDVFGYFNHVKILSDELSSVIADIECEAWTVNPGNVCAKRLLYKVSPGTVLGEVGHLQGNFDFGVFDYRTRLDYVNLWRYGDPDANGLYRPRSLYIVCPLDLYDSDTRSALYDKVARSAEPVCGTVMQDIPGTLQGNWFQTEAGADTEWNALLAFVYDNHDPSKAVISIGGVFTDPSKWEFTPDDSGLTNRKFSDVTPDGNIYCYDEGQTGRILVQLASETELQIEHQKGSCSPDLQFNDPTTYWR